ncbi:transcription repressor OFP13-like [Silene latifolia]|uniref:transcription repressor OFP13-like n=1 Tax=Silene latifolia TaxID=37657 RepID=UPI003D779052
MKICDISMRMKLIPFLSQSKSLDSKLNNNNSSTLWHIPTCGNLNTLSFRATNNNINTFYKDDNNFRTFNSAYLDTTPESFFTVSSSSRSFSTMSDDNSGDPIESVIQGLRSDRLFFEPQQSCSLVLDKQKPPEEQQDHVNEVVEDGWVYKESEAMCMESSNPCEDFRRSMEEMVEAHELKDWKGLEELLGCYLKINAKVNHGYIMAAFIDLLVNLSYISSSSSSNTTNTTLLSSLSSNNLICSSPSTPLSSILDHADDDHYCNHDDDT